MSQNIATMTSDSDILASISAHGAEAGFDELPVAFNQVEPGSIHGLRIDFANPAAGVTFEMLRKDTGLDEWNKTLADAYDHAGIEKIEPDNHHSVIAFLNNEGEWVTTLEGDYLASI